MKKINYKDLAVSLTVITEKLAASKRGETQPVEITEWFKHDSWGVSEGILLLMGLEPNGTVLEIYETIFAESMKGFRLARYLDGREVDLTAWEVALDMQKNKNLPTNDLATFAEKDETLSEIEKLNSQYHLMLRVWSSGTHQDRNPPEYYIHWANEKGFKVSWIDWVEKYRLIKPVDESPDNRRKRLEHRVTELRVKGVKGFFKQTAKEEGISSQRLRTLLKTGDSYS